MSLEKDQCLPSAFGADSMNNTHDSPMMIRDFDSAAPIDFTNKRLLGLVRGFQFEMFRKSTDRPSGGYLCRQITSSLAPNWSFCQAF